MSTRKKHPKSSFPSFCKEEKDRKFGTSIYQKAYTIHLTLLIISYEIARNKYIH